MLARAGVGEDDVVRHRLDHARTASLMVAIFFPAGRLWDFALNPPTSASRPERSVISVSELGI